MPAEAIFPAGILSDSLPDQSDTNAMTMDCPTRISPAPVGVSPRTYCK
ncbi:hypothetical protein Barb4_02690 [Bacteroidales bacterium Barb4]|nr:hypothetical protein Barb4_02690 [Bacteroidales bacterium Barb4]